MRDIDRRAPRAAAPPARVGRLYTNAQDPAGAACLASALGSRDAVLVDGGILGGLLGGGTW